MPCSIQYDPVTGEIMATVTGNFVPEIKDADRKQCVFDEHIDVEGKAVNVDEVVEGKVYESAKDIDTILKASDEIIEVESEEIIP